MIHPRNAVIASLQRAHPQFTNSACCNRHKSVATGLDKTSNHTTMDIAQGAMQFIPSMGDSSVIDSYSYFYGVSFDYAGFQLITESNSNCPLLHMALLQYINHLIWLVSCTFLTTPDNSDHLPHSSFLFPELNSKLNLGKRAFSVATPIIWNELQTTLKSYESLASFCKNLKTYLFKIAFPP